MIPFLGASGTFASLQLFRAHGNPSSSSPGLVRTSANDSPARMLGDVEVEGVLRIAGTRLLRALAVGLVVLAGCAEIPPQPEVTARATRPDDPLAAEQNRLQSERPTEAEPYVNLARQYVQRRDFAAARSVLLMLVERRSWDAYGYYLLGRVAIETESWDEAVRRLERAVELDPHEVQAWNALGFVHERLGQSGSAIAVYRQGLDANPGDARLLGGLRALVGKDADIPEAEPDLWRLRRVLFIIERRYVDAPDFGAIAAAAMRALAAVAPQTAPAEPGRSGLTRVAAVPILLAAYRQARQTAPSVPPDDLENTMIVGALTVLGRSAFIDAQEYAELQGEGSTGRGGIGLEFTARGGLVTVVEAYEGAPGHRAGLRAGDRILKIDGVELATAPSATLAGRMRGEPGTKRTLTVMRDEWATPRELDVTLQTFTVHPLVVRDLGGGVAHVRLRSLTEQSAAALAEALAKLAAGPVKGLVLDLRNHPGGLLIAAIEVTELFLPPGRVITYTEGRLRADRMRFISRVQTNYVTLPMVVLVNRHTNMGAQIIAAALQDWGRARIVGTVTGGDTSLQAIVPLGDGTGLRLATAHWFSPKGRSPGMGLTPDVAVDGEDAQLQAAVELVSPR